jgi:hypothetical protein
MITRVQILKLSLALVCSFGIHLNAAFSNFLLSVLHIDARDIVLPSIIQTFDSYR